MKKILTCLLATMGIASAYGQAKEQREQSRMNSSFAESRLSSSKAQQNFENTDVQGFSELIADPNVILLDVRTAAEFTEGHIKGAILIDQGESDFVEKAKATLPFDKKIAVYCRSGRRSANAASRLADAGYKCVNLKGGVLAWKDAGMPVSSSAQEIQVFVNQQLNTYPKSRLLDIYKSCFQDFMGAEHLVSERQRVEEYLDEELQSTNLDDLMSWYYEPCGIDGQYVRVSIRAVKEKMVSEDLLLDAFIRSANSDKRLSVESWRDRWHMIIGTIDQMQLVLPHYQQDREFIDSILSVGKYAISHSTEYREAYRPHYRIVEQSIFENEIKPLIESRTMIVRIAEIEVNPQYLKEYLAAARNVGAESIKKESGVICIFPNQMTEDENKFRIVEIYSNKEAYEHHLTTEHFQAYKQGTLHMIKELKLIDLRPLDTDALPKIFTKTNH